jgi:hypothetical protein
MPSNFAASTRPCPARIVFSASISTALVKPKVLILSAICRICFFEWVRALRFQGRNADMAMVSICAFGMAVLVGNQTRGGSRAGAAALRWRLTATHTE